MPGQLSLFDSTPPPGADAGERRLLQLGSRIVEFRFRRSRRRTIGMTLDGEGLRVAAPKWTPWREVEGFVRENQAWIEKKLAKWAGVAPRITLRGVSGEALPLFGEPLVLDIVRGRHRVEATAGALVVSLPDPARRPAVLKMLARWMRQQVLVALAPRAAHYTAQLGLPAPKLAPSNARTQWGTCSEGGLIRLNWRLAFMPRDLCDYVVAHEVSHLREMNHSKRFWAVVESLYPDWRAARRRLELTGASLPRLEGIG